MHLLVIGGGPTGVEAAMAASAYVDEVTLVTPESAGNWSKLLPSRVWLRALAEVEAVTGLPAMDMDTLHRRVRETAQNWSSHVAGRLRRHGVEIVRGRAAFASPTDVLVDDPWGNQFRLSPDRIILASGSKPWFPEGLEPDGERVFSPGTVGQMRSLPPSILIVGDGPPGFEFAHFFSRLGVSVTWAVLGDAPRSGWDPEADAYLQRIFEGRGLNVEPDVRVERLERSSTGIVSRADDGRAFTANAAFITVGYRPDLSPLNLDAAGITLDRGRIVVDDFCRTSVRTIYATGDAIVHGPGNFGMARARVAALHASDRDTSPFDTATAPVCFGENPQVAQVGMTVTGTRGVHTFTLPIANVIRAHVAHATDGFIKLAWDDTRKLVGAIAVGDGASEAVTPVAVAIRLGASLEDLAAMQGPHPTYSELPFIAARAALSET